MRVSVFASPRLRIAASALLVLLAACGVPNPNPSRPPEARPQTLSGVGLDAEYFGNLSFAGPAVRQIDTVLDFNWGSVPPAIGMRGGAFSARWTGSITPQFSETYTLHLSAKGDAQLWLDDQLILEPSKPRAALELSNTRSYNLRLEFRKTTPEASLRLEWESTSQKRESVAQKHFNPTRLNAQQVSALAVPTGQNLLLNPDFEGGTGGWLASASSNYAVVTPGRSGAGQAALASNWGWVQQNLPFTSIEGGATYTLEGWGRSMAGRACTVGLAGGNAAGDTFRQTLVFEGVWEQRSASRLVPVGTIWLAVYLSTAATECQFDDLNLRIGNNPPPPPRSSANVLNNSDFENGTTSWDVLPTNAASIGAGFAGSSLDISSWAWVQQDVAVGKLNLGQNYILRAAARAENGARCTVGLVGASSSEISFSRTLTFSESRWSEQGLQQNIPQGTVWVAVYLSTTAERCSFDQLGLEPQSADALPNPSSFTPGYSYTAPTALSLSWSPVVQASSYILERRSATTSYSILATLTSTNYTDAVVPNSFYAYRLRAVRGGQTSSGLELRFTTPPTGINGGAQAGTQGYFGPLFNWPVIPIHAALLPDGRVFSYGTRTTGQQGASVDYAVWNPARGTGPDAHIRYNNTTGTDIFCSSQLVLANGSVLVVGGDILTSNGTTTNTGNPDITIFNPLDDSLVKSPLQMLRGRWYSTSTMLANGEVLLTGGRDASNASSQVPEIYTAQGWRTLPNATTPFRSYQGYPRTFQAPDGSVFMAGPDARMYSINTSGDGSTVDRGFRDGQYRGAGISVMYDIGKILVAGGGPQANLADAMTIDINGTAPVVTRTNNMLTGRHEANATVLPNGRVLVTGGINSTDRSQVAQAVYRADTWNPSNGQWTRGASATRIRVYHSISLLMPDGTVLTGGGGAPGPQTNLNAEIYYPEYLFTKDGTGNLAPRPQILEAPATLSYNQRFTVRTPHSAEIASVSFIALGSVTHSWDMNQRFIPLSIASRGEEGLELTAPTSGNIAPPGYYMLFLNDGNGVPSVARIIRIG